MALPSAPEFGALEIFALVLVLAGIGSGLVLLRSGLGSRRIPVALGGLFLSATLGLAFLPMFSDLVDLVKGEAVVRDHPYADGGYTVAYPDGRVVDLVATPDDARSQICLQQAFEHPGTIAIQTTGKDARTFKRPPPEVFALPPSDWMSLDGLNYHTCEVVDGQPVARAKVRPIEDLTWSR